MQTHRQRRTEILSTRFNDITRNTPDEALLTVLGNAKASSNERGEYSGKP
jgi:hypothetical protein